MKRVSDVYVGGESEAVSVWLRRQRRQRATIGICFVDVFVYRPIAHCNLEPFCNGFCYVVFSALLCLFA